ncbi:aromatic amino acid exporter YddG [Ruegeria arenilitoris]|uniref:aromatic amino acid exporter YddG n=1 Tax=Ruegeria arenilitoris TaxID=1173585 RepID=UPI00147B7435|nr:EamA family transporter [Ruegeria arenilitoris]
MTKSQATAIGFVAVLLWSLLALLTVGSTPTPPLLLNAICFSIGGTLGLIWTWANGGLPQLQAVPWTTYLFGAAGLFGYHALYFSALRMAPAAEAGLIAYLWPLLIVLFSGLLPGEHLRISHLFGACLGFAGAAIIIAGGGSAGVQTAHLPGYGLALLCALTWSGYSVLSRRLGDTPTSSVAVFCIAAAIASGALHLAVEETIWPDSAFGWASVVALGLGPVGLAFYVWDIGVKQGDIQILGTASYAAPLLSTLALVGAGIAAPSWGLAIAAVLITGGAAIAARASLRR